jgi:hypothetical protein
MKTIVALLHAWRVSQVGARCGVLEPVFRARKHLWRWNWPLHRLLPCMYASVALEFAAAQGAVPTAPDVGRGLLCRYCKT